METPAPCPYRILDYGGGGFVVGAFAFPYHAYRGAMWSPTGEQLLGAMKSVKTRTPVLMGNIAFWSALVGAFECSIQTARGNKDEPLNRILAIGATRGTLAARAGLRPALLRTVEGVAVFGLIELISVICSNTIARPSAMTVRTASTYDGRFNGESPPSPSAHPLLSLSPSIEPRRFEHDGIVTIDAACSYAARESTTST
jgi:hypothetical protein